MSIQNGGSDPSGGSGIARLTWRRLQTYLRDSRPAVVSSLIGGFGSGVLFVVLLLVAVTVVQLLITGGTLEVAAPLDEKWAGLPSHWDPSTDVAIYRSRGLLPLVWSARESWYGPMLHRLYTWSLLQDNAGALAALLIAALAVGMMRAGLLYLGHWASAMAVMDATTRLRRDLHHHQFRTSLLQTDSRPPVWNLFTAQVDQIQTGLRQGVDTLGREFIKALLLITLALAMHVWLAMTVLLLIGLGWFLLSRWVPRLRQRALLAADQAQLALTHLEEQVQHTGLWQAYLMERFELEQFENHLRRYRCQRLEQLRRQSAVEPTLQVFGLILAVIVLLLAGLNVLNGRLPLTDSILFYSSLVCLYWPVQRVREAVAAIQQAIWGAVKVFAYLDRTPQMSQAVDARFLPPMQRSLEFDRVTVMAPGGQKLLDQVSFRVAAGQKIAVVGTNPAEMRAVIDLIPRFLDPTEGQIRIDGQDIRAATWESLRAQLGLVLQAHMVFTGTVADNIGCDDIGYTRQQIVDAAKLVHAHQFILNLPQGYDTVIGEHGDPLDPSQRYRIALARAALKNPAILIIEEPAVPLDETTKGLIDDALRRLCRDRAAIFWPHRMTTLRYVDQILLIHHGQLVAAGNHRELTQTNELYRHLQYVTFTAPAIEASRG